MFMCVNECTCGSLQGVCLISIILNNFYHFDKYYEVTN